MHKGKPAAKNGAKPKMPMHSMEGAKHMMPDKDMASHMAPKPTPQKPRKKGR